MLTMTANDSHSTRFGGSVAAVTGGGSGIGAAICHRLAAEGARVAVLDLSFDTAARTAESIGTGLPVEVDVSDSHRVDAAVARIERELGPLEVLVNNAGAVALEHVQRITPLLERQRSETRRGWLRNDAARRAQSADRRGVATRSLGAP